MNAAEAAAEGARPTARHKWRRAFTVVKSAVAMKGGAGARDDAAEELRVQTASKRAEAKAVFLESGGTPEVCTRGSCSGRNRVLLNAQSRGTPRADPAHTAGHCNLNLPVHCIIAIYLLLLMPAHLPARY
jgi:hypothetical protein